MMSLWDALRMNMMISYQELVRTFPSHPRHKMPRTSRAGLYTMYIRIITVYIYGNRQNLRSAAR
ncbi:hypothetical protein EAO06_03460 [Klebsiella pneumoniae]|nr:hypothetical protein EAO06_03460 [Klebsiella pneumoniae]